MGRVAMLGEVLARPDIWRGDRFAAPLPVLASGFSALDAELPGGGWPRGALSELLVDAAGIGELQLLMPALCAADGQLLLVGTPYPLHAPAWAAAGIDLSRLALVEATSDRDALWATEQALASGAPGAVLYWAPKADVRAVRRLQVAAAAGGSAAFLFRPTRVAQEASAAPLRLSLSVSTENRGSIAVTILKRRGPPPALPLHLTLPRPVRHESPLAGARPAPVAPRRPPQPVRA